MCIGCRVWDIISITLFGEWESKSHFLADVIEILLIFLSITVSTYVIYLRIDNKIFYSLYIKVKQIRHSKESLTSDDIHD